MFLSFIIPSLLLLIVIGGIVYGIYIWRRERPGSEPDAGLGTPKRVYFYSISIIGLGMLLGGVTIVLIRLFDALRGEPVLSDSTALLASGLALVIVGLPLWGFHWRFIQRSARALPGERSSILRRLYIFVALGVALGFLIDNGYRLVEFALSVGPAPSFMWSALLVWGVVWGYHWRLASSDGPYQTMETRSIRRLYLYLASTVGVVMLATGLGRLIYVILAEGYLTAFDIQVIAPGESGLLGNETRSSVALVVVGGIVAWSHWIRFAGADRESALRWVFLFMVSIGGAVTFHTGYGIALLAVLSWLIGAAVEPVGAHFDEIPAALSAVMVGLVAWRYFKWQIVREASGAVMDTVRRSYDHLLSALGLAITAAGFVSLLDIVFRLLADYQAVVVSGGAQWQNSIAVALMLLIVGIPVWWTHWRRLQAASASDPASERTALSRKLYILVVLCLGVLALAGSASATLFIFLRDLLAAELGSHTLRDVSGALSALLTSAIFVPYHWIIYRGDRVEPDVESVESPPVRKDVLVLSAAGGSEFVSIVGEALGYPVVSARWAEPDAFVPTLDADQINRLAEEVSSAPGTTVILIPDASGFRVISYD